MARPCAKRDRTPSGRVHQRPVARLLVLLTVILSAGMGTVVISAPALAASAAGPAAVLSPGQRLAPGAWLASPNRFVTLHMQLDGNLVLAAGGGVIWSARTFGWGNYLQIDATGNAGVFTASKRQLWSTHTRGAPNRLLVQDDGNLTIRPGSAQVLWSLRTWAPELVAGSRLTAGQYLTGRTGEKLTMQGDGNLVLRRGAAAVWHSHTFGHPGSVAQLLGNGQLVVSAPGGRVLWRTGLAGPRARLSISPNNNLYLRNAAGAVVWQALLPPKPIAPPIVVAPTAASEAGRLLTMWGGRLTGLPGVYSDLLATSRNQVITNGSSCGRAARVDIRLVHFLVQVTGYYRIRINNIITGHGCDSGQHPLGRSVDIATVTSLSTGAATSFGGNSGPNNLDLDRVFANYASTVLPIGAGLGQSTCPGQSSARLRAGVYFFPDVCNHQHIQVQTR